MCQEKRGWGETGSRTRCRHRVGVAILFNGIGHKLSWKVYLKEVKGYVGEESIEAIARLCFVFSPFGRGWLPFIFQLAKDRDNIMAKKWYWNISIISLKR
jgi:hypothetical protein